MKTAVEILVEQLIPKAFATYDVTTFNAIEQSKQIEKEQIIDAYENGVGDENERNLSGRFTNAEQYYNKTYNQYKS